MTHLLVRTFTFCMFLILCGVGTCRAQLHGPLAATRSQTALTMVSDLPTRPTIIKPDFAPPVIARPPSAPPVTIRPPSLPPVGISGPPAPPLVIASSTLTEATVGTLYTTTMQASGGVPPYSWAVTAGSLPAGLTLAAATGVIAGVPTGTAGKATFTMTVTDHAAAATTQAAVRSITVVAAATLANPGTTWYVRTDGGTRYSANAPSGQCDGKADTAYPGSGTNQHCAFNDVRFMWMDGTYGNSAWVIAGGDTLVIRGCAAGSGQQNSDAPHCRIGKDDANGGGICQGVNAFWGCSMPPPPNGTAGQHTRILGGCAYGTYSCTPVNTYPYTSNNLTQLFGGFASGAVMYLSGSSYVDVEGLEITSHNGQCTRYGAPAYPAPCNTGAPANDYANWGIITTNTTSNITLQDLYIHGLTTEGIGGPIGGPMTLNRVFIGFNAFAGWNFDDGVPTPDAPGSSITQSYVTMMGNGCLEEYPIVHTEFPALACWDSSSAGFGDSWSGQDTELDSFTCDHCTIVYNTKDAALGPHTLLKNLRMTNSVSIGNMGQQEKWGTQPNSTTVFQNNLIIGNCNRMSEKLPGASQNFNQSTGLPGSYLTNFCRAAGDIFSFFSDANSSVLIANNTIVAESSTVFDLSCHTSGACGSSPYSFVDNIYLGYTHPAGPVYNGSAPGLYYRSEPSVVVTASHNVEYGVRNGTCPGGTGMLCSDPLLFGEPAQGLITSESTLDNLNFHLTAGSPAIGAALVIPGITTDYQGVTRSSVTPSIGAMEYVVTQANPGTTWYIRTDGGTRYSTNVPNGQCDGKSDTPYLGSGVNQHCAFNDFRFLWDDKSGVVGAGAWVIAGGDTVLIRGCSAGSAQSNPSNPSCRIGWDAPYGSGANLWCYGVGSYTCTNPPIPAGTATQHTRILGQNYASCNTANATNPKNYVSNLTQLFGGFSLIETLNLANTQYVDLQCLELTTHNGKCTTAGSPAYPRECSNNQPLDDYAANGVVTNNATANITFQDFYVHGFNSSGFIGPIGGPITMTRVFSGFNGFAGWNFQDISGADIPDAAGSAINAHYVTMIGNGCYEEYPIVDAFPAHACYDDGSSGFGDAWSGQDTDLDSFICDHCVMAYNTKDAFIGPHTNIHTLTVTNSQSYGNMGAQWKWNNTPNATVTFENNLTVGSCSRFSQLIPGAAHSFALSSGLNGAYLSDYCRAGGNTVAINSQQNSTVFFGSNTFVDYLDTVFLLGCGPISNNRNGMCGSTQFLFTDNIFLGYSLGSNLPPGLFYLDDPSIAVTQSHNVQYGNRAGFGEVCNGVNGNICADPLLSFEPNQQSWVDLSFLDNFNFHPTSLSPAIGAGINYSGIPTFDYYGVVRPNSPAAGAVQQ